MTADRRDLVLGILVALLALWVSAMLAGCSEVPRDEAVPAAAESADLGRQLVTERLAVADATALADGFERAADAATDPERAAALRLDAERARLRADAAAAKAGVLTELRAAADARAVAQRDEISRRQADDQAAADARSDRRMAVGITVGGAVVAVGLLIVCWRLGMPLWIPGSVAAVAAVAAGVYAYAGIITAILGWVAIGLVLGAVGLGGYYLVQRLRRGVATSSAHGDRLEGAILAALPGLDPAAVQAITAAIQAAKDGSRAEQLAAGVHRLIQTGRGKA